MEDEEWLIALNNLENLGKWHLRSIICRMLGRLEGYDERNVDWFIQICYPEMPVKVEE